MSSKGSESNHILFSRQQRWRRHGPSADIRRKSLVLCRHMTGADCSQPHILDRCDCPGGSQAISTAHCSVVPKK